MARVLVIGSGGREHAICYKFSKSPQVEEVFVAPGNDGMRDVATLVPLGVNEFEKLAQFVVKNHIDLTFVGPEIPLVAGIVDYFRERNLTIFGPTQEAAMLEGSKCFAKDMMAKYSIPTATYQSFTNYDKACAYLEKVGAPIVIKADGLAAGKGVIVAMTMEEAKAALSDIMCDGIFNEAGSSVVIEEYLEGEEFSLLAFVNGENVFPLQIAQDHKRVFDGDKGPNTGGMGAYTPVSHISQSVIDEAMDKVMKPMAKAMVQEGKPFMGVLYGGMMATAKGVKTIEFNVRFGDPETEVVLLALEGDLYQIVLDVMQGKTPAYSFSEDCFVGVVLASEGYPGSYSKGSVIKGLENITSPVFHMGTKRVDDKIVSNGGRVLFVTSRGKTMEEAIENVYNEVAKVQCDTLFYRKDIGAKALK